MRHGGSPRTRLKGVRGNADQLFGGHSLGIRSRGRDAIEQLADPALLLQEASPDQPTGVLQKCVPRPRCRCARRPASRLAGGRRRPESRSRAAFSRRAGSCRRHANSVQRYRASGIGRRPVHEHELEDEGHRFSLPLSVGAEWHGEHAARGSGKSGGNRQERPANCRSVLPLVSANSKWDTRGAP